MPNPFSFSSLSRPLEPSLGEENLPGDDDSVLKPSPNRGAKDFFLCVCRWVAAPFAWWHHRRDAEVERVRLQMYEYRELWDNAKLSWNSAINYVHLRQIAWAGGTDVEGWEHHAHFKFSLEHRYSMQATRPGCYHLDPPPVLDFRTPEGREAAVEWFERVAIQQQIAWHHWDAFYWKWDTAYKAWRQDGNWSRREEAGRELITSVNTVRRFSITIKKLPN